MQRVYSARLRNQIARASKCSNNNSSQSDDQLVAQIPPWPKRQALRWAHPSSFDLFLHASCFSLPVFNKLQTFLTGCHEHLLLEKSYHWLVHHNTVQKLLAWCCPCLTVNNKLTARAASRRYPPCAHTWICTAPDSINAPLINSDPSPKRQPSPRHPPPLGLPHSSNPLKINGSSSLAMSGSSDIVCKIKTSWQDCGVRIR
jgi:hypothetical protein